MRAFYTDGDLGEEKANGVVLAIYRSGRSLFDPAVGASLEIILSDALDNYLGTIKLMMSLTEATDISARLAAIVDKSKANGQPYQDYK